MAIPEPVLSPAFNITRLSHAVLQVRDLGRARAFWADTLGLQVTDATPRRLTLRAMEERGHHCVVLEQGDTPEAQRLGFRVFSEEDLDRAAHFLASRSLPVDFVTTEFQGRTLQTHDPQGIPLEFTARMAQLPSLHQSYALYKGVKPLRIDHFNCFTPDVAGAVAFYNDLGFRVTEYTEEEGTGRLWATWMHRKGGVHDIAFTHGRGPRLHHVAFWVPTPLAIIDLLDLMATTGWVDHIERGPGRHGISNAFFLYVRDPDGHRIELYCSDYQTLDPDHAPIRWDLRDPRRQTLWGAPAPRSWFEEGTVFRGLDLREPLFAASPIVAG